MDVFMQTLKKYSDTLITENEVKQIIMYIPPEHAIFKIKGNKIYKRVGTIILINPTHR